MAVTRLQRKAKRNKLRIKFRQMKLKHLLEQPLLKNEEGKKEGKKQAPLK